jgi:hypothetical protein
MISSLTTTGSSGAATLVGGVLNIPNYAGVVYTFSTGLTNTSGTITVNTSQNITILSNLTTNGFIKTTGGTGILSIDTTTYLSTSTASSTYAPINNAAFTGTFTIPTGITGLLKASSGVVSAAVAGTDYLTPTGSIASNTGLTSSQVTTALTFTPENVANKSTDGTFASPNNTTYPTTQAVSTVVANLQSQITSASFYALAAIGMLP